MSELHIVLNSRNNPRASAHIIWKVLDGSIRRVPGTSHLVCREANHSLTSTLRMRMQALYSSARMPQGSTWGGCFPG